MVSVMPCHAMPAWHSRKDMVGFIAADPGKPKVAYNWRLEFKATQQVNRDLSCYAQKEWLYHFTAEIWEEMMSVPLETGKIAGITDWEGNCSFEGADPIYDNKLYNLVLSTVTIQRLDAQAGR
ncbi:hypothetical protein KI387_023923, partial [Taxus chinensis]